jgi:WhiB family transcriptional regulator, redox-sensing transcriptional regulator
MSRSAPTATPPGARSGLWEWQLEAACRGDSEPFFHPYGEREPSRSRREAAAKAICAGCPVLAACRAHALAAREPYGVWGGLSEEERDALLRGAAGPAERLSA